MSACKWAGRGNPRLVPGRHEDGCQGNYEPTSSHCPGCLPCTEPHCRVCGYTHHEGTCAECMAETRTNLREIGRMCGALPTEVAHRGINGEAMMLLGPVADVERRQHTEASYLAGRLPEGWLIAAHGKRCPTLVNEPCVGCAGDETHPLTILLTWQLVWRDALEHDEAPDAELATAVDYLDQQMTYMGGYPHVPFEDFARDLRRCETHLEDVLHDGEQVDEGVPCLKCGQPLTRDWGKGEKDDGWQCVKCREKSTEGQYRIAVKADYIANADWLTDVDMVLRFPEAAFTAATVRSWASEKADRPAVVRKKRHTERTVFSVEDVAQYLASKEAVA